VSVTIGEAGHCDVAVMQRIEIDAGRRFAAIGLTSIAEAEPLAAEVLLDRIAAGRAWLARDEPTGGPVGFAVASVVDGEGHLDEVCVTVDAAGRGIGAALIERVCRWALDAGLSGLTLTTFRDVAWNGPLYARLGFEALDPAHLPAELAAIRAEEGRNGIDVAPRIAMRRPLLPG
jgi:GNAT superfamily N-acetyltransferase